MLSGLLCRQARLGLSLRLTAYLSRPSQKHVLALAARQTQIHSQRAFSISRALFQEAEATPEPKVADLTQEERYNKVRWSARILFLANLPYDITEAEIRELFAPYGEIGRILLTTNEERNRLDGRAYVEFREREAAIRAFESASEEAFVLGERSLFVERARKFPQEWEQPDAAVIYVANLPWNTEENELRDLFSPYGVQRIQLCVDNQGRLNGRAFVELPTADELARVMESNSEEPFVLGDRDLSLRRATAPPVTWRRGVNNVLHIPNYPCPGDEGPLREALGDAQDKIRQVDFLPDSDGEPSKKIFIHFEDTKTAESIFPLLQGRELLGENLKVYYSKDKSSQNGKGSLGDVPNRVLFIGNYPAPGDEAPLRKLLGDEEKMVQLVTFAMENGKPTRKAFVHFANPAIAATFREKLMNKELMGVRLWIRYAVDKMNSRRLRTSAGSRTSDESRIVFDA